MSGARCKPDIKLMRLYEPASRADGTCILVGHLWSRGSRKEGAVIEYWFKDLTPSTALRQWFDDHIERWKEFRKRYRLEFAGQQEALAVRWNLARKRSITVLFDAHDEPHNDAVVLRGLSNGKDRKARTSFRTAVNKRKQT
jgi:uncharacterized protein YeaO (DUF488 family)